MNTEEYLKDLMEKRSGSVRAFAIDIGIPYSTLRSILTRGVMNSTVDNVIKICNGLGIRPEDLAEVNEKLTDGPFRKVETKYIDEEFDNEIRAIARDMKNLSSDKKELLKNLIKTMSDAGDQELEL